MHFVETDECDDSFGVEVLYMFVATGVATLLMIHTALAR